MPLIAAIVLGPPGFEYPNRPCRSASSLLRVRKTVSMEAGWFGPVALYSGEREHADMRAIVFQALNSRAIARL